MAMCHRTEILLLKPISIGLALAGLKKVASVFVSGVVLQVAKRHIRPDNRYTVRKTIVH